MGSVESIRTNIKFEDFNEERFFDMLNKHAPPCITKNSKFSDLNEKQMEILTKNISLSVGYARKDGYNAESLIDCGIREYRDLTSWP